MEAVNGVEKEIDIRAPAKCTTCSGSGAKPGTKVTNCRSCGGSGMVYTKNRLFEFASPCQTCGGEGSVISSPCTTCKGKGTKVETRTLKVKIPSGVETGATIRMMGQGGAGPKGVPPGNLYLRITVKI
jgi:molecular chaperone DnaJ